jgi:hypothetical protein
MILLNQKIVFVIEMTSSTPFVVVFVVILGFLLLLFRLLLSSLVDAYFVSFKCRRSVYKSLITC